MTTISLELSCKISNLAKEKGIELPKSYFEWFNSNIFPNKMEVKERWLNCSEDGIVYPAFLLDEILSILPSKIKTDIATYWFEMSKEETCYTIGYYSYSFDIKDEELISYDTLDTCNLTESAGLMLEWVLDNYPETLKESK